MQNLQATQCSFHSNCKSCPSHVERHPEVLREIGLAHITTNKFSAFADLVLAHDECGDGLIVEPRVGNYVSWASPRDLGFAELLYHSLLLCSNYSRMSFPGEGHVRKLTLNPKFWASVLQNGLTWRYLDPLNSIEWRTVLDLKTQIIKCFFSAGYSLTA